MSRWLAWFGQISAGRGRCARTSVALHSGAADEAPEDGSDDEMDDLPGDPCAPRELPALHATATGSTMPGKPVDERQGEQERIDPVEDATEPRQPRAGVLHAEFALGGRLEQVAPDGTHGDDHRSGRQRQTTRSWDEHGRTRRAGRAPAPMTLPTTPARVLFGDSRGARRLRPNRRPTMNAPTSEPAQPMATAATSAAPTGPRSTTRATPCTSITVITTSPAAAVPKSRNARLVSGRATGSRAAANASPPTRMSAAAVPRVRDRDHDHDVRDLNGDDVKEREPASRAHSSRARAAIVPSRTVTPSVPVRIASARASARAA